MNNKVLHSIFPLRHNNIIIDAIDTTDINDVIKIMKTKYYNKYLKFNFNKNITEINLSKYLNKKIQEWNFNSDINVVRLKILDAETLEYIGLATIFDDIDNERVEIAYSIVESKANNGYATYVLKTLTKIIYNKIYDKIVVNINRYNKASIKVANKSGYKIIEKNKNILTLKFMEDTFEDF